MVVTMVSSPLVPPCSFAEEAVAAAAAAVAPASAALPEDASGSVADSALASVVDDPVAIKNKNGKFLVPIWRRRSVQKCYFLTHIWSKFVHF